ncbi:hypothetical protein LTR56_013222 [Elasticomyces elasticus]|nr:hypothetical protein LTR56_013222 [Elasticomyces elasticus]KAK3650079.1 hypothetical protein LTR22_012674 [Elasticomyces elasticus]KAK4920086.1 hypothetical protein LTR49_012347 [Elasticomyces elasticus]KAK5733905.1 hypothetical protein LTR17_009312 [Elasticomyces elasticus]KAK5757190.1 hypothetical protein LTS12_012706 [Elasticomyces elasticus]
MDQILEQARSLWEGEVDFEGQRLADYLTYGLLTISGVIAFLVGFATQNIYQTLYIGLGGTAVTFLAVVPQWPFFNQHPLPWLPPKNAPKSQRNTGLEGINMEGISIEVDGQKVG